jgi:superfamily I DNA and/or RNA helicase
MEGVDTPVLDLGTDVDKAAAAIERIWSPDEDKGPPVEKQKQENAEAPERAEAQQAEDEAETPEPEAEADEAEAEDEGAEDEAEDDAEGAEPKALDPATPVTVKVDGKELEVPLSEALAGYQRQSDYSRKTQQLADERRQFYGEVQQVRAERAQYAQMLPALQQQIAANAPQEPDWERLKSEDPIEFAIKREEWRDRQEKLAAAHYEQQRVAVLRQREEQEALRSQVEDERQQLLEKIPEFRDQKVWQKSQQALREYGQKLGYAPEELAAAYDHRAVVALYKAMRYDAMMEKKPVPVKPKAAPAARPAPTTLRPGSAATAPRAVTEVTRAKQRLAKTGSINDAAMVFDKLLG